MMHPKRFEKIFGRRKGMNGIMHKQVKGITEQEARQDAKDKLSEQKPEQEKEERRDQQAHDRGHGQAFFIFREIVVVAVKGILDVFLHLRIGIHVKEMTMGHVFHEGKKKPTKQKKAQGRYDGNEAVGVTVGDQAGSD